MKKLTTLMLLGALGLAAPAVAGADATTTAPTAQQQCRTERGEMGRNAFAQLYGTNHNKRNAFGRCVSKRDKATEKAADDAADNAPATCRAERSADRDAFTEKYGTNRNKRNAFGKCVSQTARAATAEVVEDQVEADVEAAQTCKAERRADRAAFAEKYGTNRNKRNAFGKCVAKARKHADA